MLHSGRIVCAFAAILPLLCLAGSSRDKTRNWTGDSALLVGELVALREPTSEAPSVAKVGAAVIPAGVRPATAMFYDGCSAGDLWQSRLSVSRSTYTCSAALNSMTSVNAWKSTRANAMSQDLSRQLGAKLELDAAIAAATSVGGAWILAGTSTAVSTYLGPRVAAEFGAAGALGEPYGAFKRTAHYLGSSMQILNPNILLDTKHDFGWTGTGSANLGGGNMYFWDSKLMTDHLSITRNTLERIDMGVLHTTVNSVIETPVVSGLGLETWSVMSWPTGSYHSLGSTTHKITTTRSNFTETTRGGITTYKDHITGKTWTPKELGLQR